MNQAKLGSQVRFYADIQAFEYFLILKQGIYHNLLLLVNALPDCV
jgi:hypothetical protein